MAFLKHIGRHGDRKVAVIFRQIPGDDHMCLVIYPEVLPSHMHDSIMKVLESSVGQGSEDLADALHRNMFPDGRNMLETLHAERMMKRVNTEQIIVTPTLNSSVKLSELNNILNEMKLGEGAVRRLAEIDSNAGLVDGKTKRSAEQKFKESQTRSPANLTITPPANGALSDRELAANLLAQAERMHQDGNSLLKESARLRKEAELMDPKVSATESKKKTVDSHEQSTSTKPSRRGRPSRAKTENA